MKAKYIGPDSAQARWANWTHYQPEGISYPYLTLGTNYSIVSIGFRSGNRYLMDDTSIQISSLPGAYFLIKDDTEHARWYHAVFFQIEGNSIPKTWEILTPDLSKLSPEFEDWILILGYREVVRDSGYLDRLLDGDSLRDIEIFNELIQRSEVEET